MRQQGITNADLERALLLGTTAVSQRLNGHRGWSLEEIYKVMDLLQVPHEYMHILFPADIYSRKRLPVAA